MASQMANQSATQSRVAAVLEPICGSCVGLLVGGITRPGLEIPVQGQRNERHKEVVKSVVVEQSEAEGSNDILDEAQESGSDHRVTAAQEWSSIKRITVAGTICLYTFVVYASSAIYIIGIPGIMLEFGVSEQEALLGLSLYVLAYGMGPILWAPLSELDFVGRSPVYGLTFTAFLGVSVLVATAKTWSGFLALRFLQGFFGSPCLANGGASMHDLYPDLTVPYSMAVWIAAAYCGPSLGPLISSHLVPDQGWRKGMWEIVWMAAPTLVLVLLLPETYDPAVKVRSKKRLSVISVQNLRSAQARGKTRLQLIFDAVRDAIFKPVQIMLLDPAVAVANFYTSFVYGAYYTFFDVFPLVYISKYDFSVGELGLSFLSIIVACLIGGVAYCAYIHWTSRNQVCEGRLQAHEECLRPALVACVLPPVGLFLFGWTSDHDIHWIFSLIGVTIYATGVYIILQCLSVYLPRIYLRYAASLFAANDLCRSAAAAGMIHAGIPLYGKLGVSHGISVLGAITVLGVPGMWFMYLKGPTLRAKSRFVVAV